MNEEEWLDGLRHLSNDQIVQAHFGLQDKIKHHYKLRAKGDNLQKAIHLCQQHIALAPIAMAALKAKHDEDIEQYRKVTGREPPRSDFYSPGHHGYRQYAVILRRQKEFDKLAELEEKKKSEGWAD